VALAEELVGRGLGVVFLGDLGGLPFAQRQLADRGLPLLPAPVAPEDLADLAVSLGLAAVVLDDYHLDPGCGAALTARGLPVLALSDGGFGAGQRATIHLDQNLGAVPPAHLPPGTEALSGLAHVLLRDLVRSRRPAAAAVATTDTADTADTAGTHGPASVLAVFGGTDPTAAVLTVAPLVLGTGEPLHLRAIASTPATVEALQRLRPGPGQTLTVLPPADDLPALAVRADLVVSAAGSSVWELLCLGVPTALVCVSDNQEAGYREVVGRGLVEGLGHVAALRDHEPTRTAASARLGTLLRDPGARARLAARGVAEVDGRGRERVADALCRQLGIERKDRSCPAPASSSSRA
jgi:spore coat polysaccharide biosynthesis predicted glycosyltransferase SpsG